MTGYSWLARAAVALLALLPSMKAAADDTPEKRITAHVVGSSCANFAWKNRGRAPIGYVKGVALTYAKSFCELERGQQSAAVEVMSSPLADARKDALAHYALTPSTANERLRSIYTLALGLGMRESSGNTTEGVDATVDNPTAENAEAGIFQVSHDSIGKSPALKPLWDQYSANTNTCHLDVFRERVSDRKRPLIGEGVGADFQKFTKECPAFATEYVMVLLRVNRTHHGPINRKEAEYVQACNDLLAEIETIAKPSCAQLSSAP